MDTKECNTCEGSGRVIYVVRRNGEKDSYPDMHCNIGDASLFRSVSLETCKDCEGDGRIGYWNYQLVPASKYWELVRGEAVT
jgi:hypothetical protein